MIPQQLVKTSFPALRDEVLAVLRLVETYGVSWRNTRFDRYLVSIEEAAAQSYPRSVTWERDRDKQRLFWEAANQTQQLINASVLWSSQDATVVTRKLEAIVKGRDLPAVGSDYDHPRNTLLELTTAALLYRSHFEVTLSADAEDTLATLAGQPPFAVECKRPTGPKSLEKNLKEIRRQLRNRLSNKDKQGIAVIAADRLMGLNASMPFVQTMDDLIRILDHKAQEWGTKIRSTMQRPGLAFFPSTKLAAIVVVGTVFVGAQGMPVTLGRLGFFITAVRDDLAGDFVDVIYQHLLRPPRDLRLSQAADG